MQKILVIIFLSALYFNAIAQEKNPELQVMKNLSKLNSKNSSSLKKIEDVNAAKSHDFTFSINPYLWGIAVGGKIAIPALSQTFDFNKSFSDAIKHLKMAVMVNGKFKYKKVSLLYDIAYINLKRFNATAPNGLGLISANITIKELLTDLALAYSIPLKGQKAYLDGYAGVRIFSAEGEITTISSLRTEMRSEKKTWVDPIIGLSSSFILSPKWFSYFKGDVGGFGVNSQFTWMILGGVGYMFSGNWNTSLGIKNVGVNYNKDAFAWTLNQYGLLLSVGFRY